MKRDSEFKDFRSTDPNTEIREIDILKKPIEREEVKQKMNHQDSNIEGKLKKIESFIDELQLNEFAAKCLKVLILPVSFKVLNSEYINSNNDGKLHLQSFGLGIILAFAMVIIQPFLTFYLDGWILFIGKLLKNLIGWLVFGCLISYFLNHNKKEGGGNSNYQELQYTVKNSKSSPQVKKAKKVTKIAPYSTHITYDKNGPVNETSELLLKKITQHQQDIDDARYEVNNSRIDEDVNYNKFMNIALKKDKEIGIYNKFVSDNKGESNYE